MDLNNIPILGMLTEKMAWLSRRQRVLVQNVANADTPGYKARDLEKPDFGRLLGAAKASETRLAASDARHLPGSRTSAGPLGAVKADTPETSPNGNSVDLPMEMMKMGETQMDYSTTASLYRKHVRLLKIAIGRDR